MGKWIEKQSEKSLIYKDRQLIMDQNVINDVKRIASGILKDDRILSEENFNFLDAENMDSVNRVAILVEIEKEYDFIFKLKEISSWNTVEELAAIIEKKM